MIYISVYFEKVMYSWSVQQTISNLWTTFGGIKKNWIILLQFLIQP